MSKVLIIAEHHQQQLTPACLATITAGLQLGSQVDVLLLGEELSQVSKQCATVKGVAQVLCFTDPSLSHLLAENVCTIVTQLTSDYEYLLAPSSTFGKNIMPRIAAKCHVPQISDITAIINDNTFIRPIYAGNAFETVSCDAPLKVITVRPTAFERATEQTENAPIKTLELSYAPHTAIQFEKAETPELERPELTSASRVISGGRGLGSRENFQLIERVADKLNAAIGASRAAVDAGFVPNDYQVGQTGKVIAPDLYIAVGISGAIQHLAGIKDSKIIVAINKDPDAPIFQVADYGLVGDLFDILPQFEKALG